MLQNQASVKVSLNAPGRPIECGKFIDALSDSMLQQFLRNYHLTSFGIIFFLPLPEVLCDFPSLLLHNLERNLKALPGTQVSVPTLHPL